MSFCSEYPVDALVTGSELLLCKYPGFVLGNANILRMEEALALMGLFLRSRGEYALTCPHHWYRSSYEAESFFIDLARALLTCSSVWLGAADAHRRAGNGDNATLLAKSLLGRVTRVLRARDALQIARRGRRTSDTAHQVAVHFEAVLVALSSAFDALADLFDLVYSTGRRSWNWRDDGRWLKKLENRSEVRQVLDLARSSEVRNLLQLIADLRNTIHSPSMEPTSETSSSGVRFLLEFPSTRLEEIQKTLDLWKGVAPEWWGIELHRRGTPDPSYRGPGQVYRASNDDPVSTIRIEPGLCVERLLPLAMRALDRLAMAIDWSRLSGAGQGFLPINCELDLMPGEQLQERIRLLGGVG